MFKLKCNRCDGAFEDELDVRFGTACDNNCSFCATRRMGKSPLQMDVEKMIDTTIAEGHRSIINIVGGEPLLSNNLPNLLVYLQGIRHVTDNITIVTSLPYIEDTSLFDEIMALTDYLVVSIQHYNPAGNNYILRATDNYDRIEQLRRLSKNPKYSAKLSVTLNLSQTGISSKKELFTAIQFIDSLGIKTMRINELQNTEECVHLRDIWPELKYKSPYSHGCNVNILRQCKKNISISHLKSINARFRCFMLDSAECPSWLDVIKLKIKYDSEKYCTKHNLKLKYGANRHGVLYEDGHSELKY